MTISKRLAILISVALACVILVGLFSIRQMGLINEDLQYAQQNSIPSIRKVASMESSFLRIRISILSFIAAPEEQKPAHEKRYFAAKEELERHLRDYEKLISDEKDKAYLEVSKKLVAEYLPITHMAIEAIKAGQPDKAKTGMAPAAELSKKLTENLEAHAKYNEDLAENEVMKAEETFRSGKTVGIVTMLLATALTCIIGFLLYRDVSKSLGSMVGTFSHIESSLDFTTRLPVTVADEVGQASMAFNRLLDRLQTSFSEIARHTATVNVAANRMASEAGEMANASALQSNSATAMAATVEEMTVSIQHVADRSREATELSISSGAQARHGETVILQTASGINGIADTVRVAADQIAALEQHSDRINNVVAVIKEVADQTNLLALNAAIEAARAGEQGRGFAVVADEVRKLAERTTQSTQEISTTITAMQNGAEAAVQGIQAVIGSVESGVSAANDASQTIQNIALSSGKAVDMVSEINDAIREQTFASTSISNQVEQIAQISERNNASSANVSGTAKELAFLAQKMQDVVSLYRV